MIYQMASLDLEQKLRLRSDLNRTRRKAHSQSDRPATGSTCDRCGRDWLQPGLFSHNRRCTGIHLPTWQWSLNIEGCLSVAQRKETNKWCNRPQFCSYTAILGWEQPGIMRWILLWIMIPVLDRSLDLLTSSTAHYHCTMDAAWKGNKVSLPFEENIILGTSLYATIVLVFIVIVSQ